MAKGRVIVGATDDYPPLGSVGTVWSLTNGNLAFVPDNSEHIPPDCEPSEFAFYPFDPKEIEILEVKNGAG